MYVYNIFVISVLMVIYINSTNTTLSTTDISYYDIFDKSNTTGATRGAVTVYHLGVHVRSPPGFCGVRIVRSLIFYAMFCRLLVVLSSFFLWQVYCLSF